MTVLQAILAAAGVVVLGLTKWWYDEYKAQKKDQDAARIPALEAEVRAEHFKVGEATRLSQPGADISLRVKAGAGRIRAGDPATVQLADDKPVLPSPKRPDGPVRYSRKKRSRRGRNRA